MTTITLPEARAVTTPPSATLWTLTRFEAKRYAKHPLFLAGLVLAIITSLTKGGPDELDYHVIPSFFIGVLGIIVAGRLASATRRSDPVIGAAPVSESMRTAALCLACLVPTAAGVFLVVLHRIYIAANPYPKLVYGTYGTFDRYLITMVVPVIACAGAPLLGIAVARWLRFPGASLLAAVVVVLWSAVSAYIQQGGSAPTSGFKQVVHMLTPYTAFGASNANSSKAPTVITTFTGSVGWFAIWTLLLCGLAVTAALWRSHGTAQSQRGRVGQTFVGLAVCAVIALVLAVANGNHRLYDTSKTGTVPATASVH
jgi:hypothetical protein